MVSKDAGAEIALVSCMKRYNLTVDEAKEAMRMYADDKQFQKDLDDAMQHRVYDDWDYWHDNDIA